MSVLTPHHTVEPLFPQFSALVRRLNRGQAMRIWLRDDVFSQILSEMMAAFVERGDFATTARSMSVPVTGFWCYNALVRSRSSRIS